MIGGSHTSGMVSAVGPVRALAVVAVCLALGACAQSGSGALDFSSPVNDTEAAAKDTRTDLAKATETAGKAFAKEPRDPDKAVAYARNLKALGEKRQALAVLQHAAGVNPGHRELNSEYGRLALDLDQISVAQRLLQAADDPTNPDWRVISARGTVLAKQGSYRDAIPLYERALALAPNQPSILNNLALARAMEGHADQAEPLLKRAVAADGKDPRVSQIWPSCSACRANTTKRRWRRRAICLPTRPRPTSTMSGASSCSSLGRCRNPSRPRPVWPRRPLPVPTSAARRSTMALRAGLPKWPSRPPSSQGRFCRRANEPTRHPGSRGAAETVRDLQQPASARQIPALRDRASARPLRPG